MKKETTIKSYSSDELRQLRESGESQTDLARVHAKTEVELENDIASDTEFHNVPADWYKAAEMVIPPVKQLLSLRLDTDVVNWFREQGPGYQTRINAVLRVFVQQQSKTPLTIKR